MFPRPGLRLFSSGSRESQPQPLFRVPVIVPTLDACATLIIHEDGSRLLAVQDDALQDVVLANDAEWDIVAASDAELLVRIDLDAEVEVAVAELLQRVLSGDNAASLALSVDLDGDTLIPLGEDAEGAIGIEVDASATIDVNEDAEAALSVEECEE